ncbi:amino acid adenylation domain-containing protein [Pseudomonas sp. NPDC089406]|uniref:amino acid adenylation domain-containing protein n=1 Tax=Pseudomonas sp. NPDC089406 TaxID=3364463 RepID=UPI00384D94C2
MNADDARKLARRFQDLPVEKRRLFLGALEREGVDFSVLPIPAGGREAHDNPLSYAQQRMWLLWQLDPQGNAYNLPSAVRLRGALNRPALEQAFAGLFERHATLRTLFGRDEQDAPCLEAGGQALNIEHEDLAHLCQEQREQAVGEYVGRQAALPFDLERGPLLRVALLRLAEQEHVLVLVMHHIIADGWSMNALIDEFIQRYDAAVRGQVVALPALPIQYGDYALWQRAWLEAGEQERQLEYWRAQLGDEHPVLLLPTDFPRAARPGSAGGRHELEVPEALAARLRECAREHNVTLFMLLLGLFAALLQRYAGQPDIRLGVPVANRNRAEVEGLIGCFVNTQVLRVQPDPQQGLAALLQQVRQVALGAQAHQELPFEQLVEGLGVAREGGHNPLFQVMFNHQSQVADLGQVQQVQGLQLQALERERHTTRFDLALDTFERGGRLFAAFTYRLELFQADTLERMAGHWLTLVEGWLQSPATALGELPLLSAAQQARQQQCNATARPREADTCIHHLIERQAAAHPQRLAAVHGERSLTWAELDAGANRLARHLRTLGAGPDVLVGIAVERSLDMLLGMLAVLKAGAAYVPFDPQFPEQRLGYMLEDSGVAVLLTQQAVQGRLPQVAGLHTLLLDDPAPAWASLDGHALDVAVAPANLAYVIYTSGSTGQAKGVSLSHAGLVNYVQGIFETLPLQGAQSMAVVSTLAADLGHTTLFGALCSGATLHVLDLDLTLDADRFADYMAARHIDVLKIVPSHIEALLSERHRGAGLPRQCLVLGGESASPALLARLAEWAPECRVINHYGPTETTVGVLTAALGGAQPPALGRPLPNLRAQVLDAELQALPVGVDGELLIGGAGLARGYHRRPGLTAERFVPDPFGPPGARLYRSGDLVSQDADGRLRFRGRVDHQVKIRGYRIELGEIEARLRELAGVREAHCRVLQGQLVAYVVAPGIDNAGWKPALARSLPDYMVPATFVQLEAMPLTLNGKLDPQALAALLPDAPQALYEAPQTALQQQLAQIWAQVLEVAQVGLADSFFGLGGHSLLATQIVSRVRRLLDADVPLRTLFDSADLRAFADAVQALRGQAPTRELLAVGREAPLLASFAQQRQWLFWTLEPHSVAYHTPLVADFTGALDRAALQATFAALVARHEALRTHFKRDGEQLLQVVEAQGALRLEWERVDEADALQARIEAEVNALFDLERGPLMRARVFELAADRHVLVVTLHHIVSDGGSMGVLGREFAQLYRAFQQGEAAGLAPLALQYADYAQWQRQWLEAGEMQRQLDYWRTQLGSEHPVLELPCDHPRGAGRDYREGRLDLRLPEPLAQAVRQYARQQRLTLFQVFVAAYAMLLQRYCGQRDIRIGLPVNNRNAEALEGVVGFFVNTLVLRLDIDPQQALEQIARQARDTALAAQAHQDLPFDRLVEALNPQRSLQHNPLFQVMYNHLNTVGAAAAGSLPGVQAQERVLPAGQAQFDLTLETLETDHGIQVAFLYAAELFEPASITAMADAWLGLLQALVEQPQQALGNVVLQTPEDWQRRLAALPDTPHDAPDSVLAAFARQVQRAPQALALVQGEERLDYAALDLRSDQVAAHLRAEGVGPESLVAIVAERGIALVVGLLGIFKAGGGYLPLDPAYPAERLAYMLEDSGAQLVLGERALLARLAPTQRTLALEDIGQAHAAFAAHPLAQSLAYVIYTSGSTGQPKGVAVSHGALAMHCQNAAARYSLGPQDRLLQFASISFDAAAEQIFMPLTQGAALVLGDVGQWGYEQLLEQVQAHGISVLDLPPSYLARIVEAAEAGSPALTVRACILGGEAWSLAQIAGLSHLRAGQLFNAYGPTEAVISPLIHACDVSATHTLYAPIGTPVGARSAWLLDSDLALTPGNALGELCLGGAGLARGYLGRAGLTAASFVPDPFGAAGARLYRTGDLARLGRDGVFEYHGRRDQQVKLRGLRIELGEIESALRDCPQVMDAAVLVQALGQGGQLVAYVVPRDPATLAADSLRAQLRQRLPEHMVPGHWQFLEALPLNANGKLDRPALPLPELARGEHQAPRSVAEVALARIWAELLKCEQVGLQDNFFELGGDSIISLQVVSRARQAGLLIKSKDLFQYQTLQAVAAVAQAGEHGVQAEQGLVQGAQTLLPIQQSFFEEVQVDRHHWNQSVLLAPAAPLDPLRLEQALQALLTHHDALRLGFNETADGWQAHYRPLAPQQTLLRQAQASDEQALAALCQQLQGSLDLAQGPLLRGLLVALADGSQRLFLVVHHLVVDGVSWRILFEDLQAVYRQLEQGQAPRLAAKTSAYRDWAERLVQWANSAPLRAQLAYWEQQCAPGANLPIAPGQALQCRARTVYSRLDAATTERLLQQAPQAWRTQVNDLLLSALARVLCRWSGAPSVLLELEGHGRDELFDGLELSRTVGWFTSLYPLRLTPAASPVESLRAVKEQLRAVPDKGIGHGALRHLGEAAVRQRLAALPRAQVLFNYLGQFDASFDADGALLRPAGDSGSHDHSEHGTLSHALSLDGQVYGGCLSIGWTFADDQLDPALVQGLAEQYCDELRHLVDACCAPGAGGLTPSDVPLAALDQAALDGLGLPLACLEDLYPLSPMQQGMLFHALYEQGTGDYVNQMHVQVEGLDPVRFREAWAQTLQAHAPLRSGFLWQGDLAEPLQFVHRQVPLPFEELDWRDLAEPEQALGQLLDAERARGFDLRQPPLLRLCLARTDADRYWFVCTNHHILMDGWSYARLFGEVLERYHGHAPAASGGRYRDYISWLQQVDGEAAQQYWTGRLAELEAPTRLAQAMGGSPRAEAGRARHARLIDAARTQALGAFARRHKVTANVLVQAAWMLLLQRYTGQASVAFGTTVAGRPAQVPGIDRQVGLFINTLPVIGTPAAELSVAAWMQQVQADSLERAEHESTPLFEIQRWAGLGGESLFDSLLVFENYPVGEALRQRDASALRFGSVHSHEQTHYPLALAVELGEALHLGFDYAQGQFASATVERLAEHLDQLLAQFVESADRPLGELRLALPAEQALACARNATPAPGDGLLVQQRISQWAARQPQSLAVVQGERALSFAELEQRANQLAHWLVGEGVGPEVRVAVALPRDEQLPVALLAVLKAGGAFVPLDIGYPPERLAYLLQDSAAALLLVDSRLPWSAPLPPGVRSLAVDQLALQAKPATPPQVAIAPQNLAYIIYTSGSTGLPKGVAVEHGPLAMHCQSIGARYEMSEADCELLFMSFAFDGAHERWLTSLTHGARVLLRDDALWTPEQTFAALHRHGVSVAAFPPVYLQQLAEHAERVGNPPPMRVYCFGGDAVPSASYELARRALRPRYIINGYGPTETVVTPLIWKAGEGDQCQAAYAPIGDRVGARTAQVLDASLQLLPDGLAGELYLGGEGVARGYLNRPGLTAERFVPDPHGAPGARLYRSGDLVRQRADGLVDCLGRIDHQVKIRGFRIELGEIEACLKRQPGVRDAVAVAREGAHGKVLAAYVVPTGRVPADPAEALRVLRTELEQQLPAYMVPAQWACLEHLPLNPNGKVDRKALPEPLALAGNVAYRAPQGELQERLAAIWQAVLHSERVGQDDNFFELGGHSLLATQVTAQLQLELGLELNLDLLFKTRTLAEYAEAVAGRMTSNHEDDLSDMFDFLNELEAN